jgi:1,4-alpha-glucan branching enzyme
MDNQEADVTLAHTQPPAPDPQSNEVAPEGRTPAQQQFETLSVPGVSLLSDLDVYLFKSGKHFKLYEKLGSHVMEHNGIKGTYFALWAPNAEKVSVIGSFNGWNRETHPLYIRFDGSGIWEGFVPGAGHGDLYKYFIQSKLNGYRVEKGDPFAFRWEEPPLTASVVWDLGGYEWQDQSWILSRQAAAGKPQPWSVYEVHFGSWKRNPEENNRSLTYREMAEEMPAYVKDLGFTHVEFMPIMEHPFYGSWGYQITGYFAPSSRYGTPQDFMYLIDAFHRAGIGVILDWVPSHFPGDLHGPIYFDGSHLYEHADPRQGFHPDWQSYIFNYGRSEVRAFLISNALFWLDHFHTDGLRVDAVASMLYLDYSRKEGEWIPNIYGGRENLEAISFLKEFNETVYREFPDVQTIAEESTAYTGVSRPTYLGGLGFGMKWMMGWMHDTLSYFANEPVYRKYHHGEITFSAIYAFTENFMLPLSHDEVVYGKHPLVYKMSGDEWQKFANLRTLYGYMYAHPGTKLLFMGGEFGQTSEWGHERSLDWHLLDYKYHQGVQQTVRDLNRLYRTEPALYELQFEHTGFEWSNVADSENSVIGFLRKGKNPDDVILVVCNFTPVPRMEYRMGVNRKGFWQEIFNSDAEVYGGSGMGNYGGIVAEYVRSQGKDFSLRLVLPPLSVSYFKWVGEQK